MGKALLSSAFVQPNHASYVPHLDGLRAIALLGVLLYHFEFRAMRGGYTGVDVFFVLSGFLMTRNIRGRVEEGQFNLAQFYKSRFWRLYPSSLFTSVIALIGAYVMFPLDLQTKTLRSALASSFMCSNVLFSTEIGGYFDAGAVRKPLLHTWSLSLEEQFYLVWPLILVVTTIEMSKDEATKARAERVFLGVLTFICAASFTLAVFLSAPTSRPVFAWFHLPTRAYEFAAGAVAYKFFDPMPKAPMFQSVLSGTGLMLILASFVALDRDTPDAGGLGLGQVARTIPFPGWASLPPCVGAILAIICPRSVFSSNYLLANPVVRHLGKISYAAYLVHWPLWVFLVFATDNRSYGTYALLATLVLAELQFRWVETPARSASRSRSGGFVFLSFAFVTCALLLSRERVGSTTLARTDVKGFNCGTEGDQQLETLEDMGNMLPPEPVVFKNVALNMSRTDWAVGFPKDLKCSIGIQARNITHARVASLSSPPRAVLIGDSFGRFAQAVGEALDHGYLIASFFGGCFQFLDEKSAPSKMKDVCINTNKCTRTMLQSLPEPVIIFFTFRWEQVGCGKTEADNCPLYRQFLSWIPPLVEKGHKVVVVGSPPRGVLGEKHYDPKNCLQRQKLQKSLSCPQWAPALNETTMWNNWFDEQISPIRGVKFMHLGQMLCRDDELEECLNIFCGEALYEDGGGHLTPMGMAFLKPQIRRVIEGLDGA